MNIFVKGVINRKTIVDRIQKVLDKNPEGVNVKITPYKSARTSDQNSYYWLICADVARHLNDAGVSFKKVQYGEKEFSLGWDNEIIHLLNKVVFGVKTTTSLTKKDFCDYMEKVFSLWIDKTEGHWAPPIDIKSYFPEQGTPQSEKQEEAPK